MPKLRFYSYDERGYDFDALVEQNCNECFIRVSGFTGEDKVDKAVYISQVTFHNNVPQLPFKIRIGLAWSWLRGKGVADYEILTAVEMDNFIEALSFCREVIFGKVTELK